MGRRSSPRRAQQQQHHPRAEAQAFSSFETQFILGRSTPPQAFMKFTTGTMKSSPNREAFASSSSGLRLFGGAALLLSARAVRCPQIHDGSRMGQAMPHVKSRFLN
jgi:hypothetical protein